MQDLDILIEERSERAIIPERYYRHAVMALADGYSIDEAFYVADRLDVPPIEKQRNEFEPSQEEIVFRLPPKEHYDKGWVPGPNAMWQHKSPGEMARDLKGRTEQHRTQKDEVKRPETAPTEQKSEPRKTQIASPRTTQLAPAEKPAEKPPEAAKPEPKPEAKPIEKPSETLEKPQNSSIRQNDGMKPEQPAGMKSPDDLAGSLAKWPKATPDEAKRYYSGLTSRSVANGGTWPTPALDMALEITKNPKDPRTDSLASDATYAILEGMGDFRPNPNSSEEEKQQQFAGYARKIAWNTVQNSGRKEKTQKKYVGETPPAYDAPAPKGDSASSDLREAIESIPDPTEKKVAEMMMSGEAFSSREIAKTLGISHRQGNEMKNRILAYLQKYQMKARKYRYMNENHVPAGSPEGGQFTGKAEHGQSPDQMASKLGSGSQRSKLEAVARNSGYDDADFAGLSDDEMMAAFGGGLKPEKSGVRQQLEDVAREQGYEDSDFANLDDDEMQRAFGGGLKSTPQTYPQQQPATSKTPTPKAIADMVVSEGGVHMGELYKKFPGVPHDQINEIVWQARQENPGLFEAEGVSSRHAGEWSDEEWKNLLNTGSEGNDAEGRRFGYLVKKGATPEQQAKAFNARPLAHRSSETGSAWYERIKNDPKATPELVNMAKNLAASESRMYDPKQRHSYGPRHMPPKRIEGAVARLEALRDHSDDIPEEALADEVDCIAREFDADELKTIARDFGIDSGLGTKAITVMKIFQRVCSKKKRRKAA